MRSNSSFIREYSITIFTIFCNTTSSSCTSFKFCFTIPSTTLIYCKSSNFIKTNYSRSFCRRWCLNENSWRFSCTISTTKIGYIDINDLADAHVISLAKHDALEDNFNVFNLGSGSGTSVLEIIET